MTSQAVLTYTAFLGGGSAANVAALMAAVPVPASVLQFLGLRVTGDSTPAASPVVRTITLALGPSSNATATAVLDEPGATGSGVRSVTVTGTGNTYVVPPIVTFTGGRTKAPANQAIPFQGIRRSHQTLAPTLAPENEFSFSDDTPAVAVAYLKVVSATVVSGGSGYSAGTHIAVVGGLKKSGAPPSFTAVPPVGDGVAAVLTPTVGGGGAITGVALTSPGSGYTSLPVVTVVDPMGTGSGAVIAVTLGVERIDVLRKGAGYTNVPTVVLTPSFQALFPPGVSPFTDQATPLRNLMTTVLEQAISSPVTASEPVIS